jgi:PAS domain S-box-containing protein
MIACVAQDSTGFIWIATRFGGLYRYDGLELIKYLHDDSDSTSISSNFITDLLVDSQGNLWVIGQSDYYKRNSYIDKFDPLTNTFIHILKGNSTTETISDFKEGTSRNYYFFALKTRLGKILLRNQSYELQYQSQIKTTNNIKLPRNTKIAQILPKSDQKLILIIIPIGIAEYDIKTGLADFDRFAKLNSFFKAQKLIPNILLVDRNGLFWIGTSSGLIKYNLNDKTIKHYLTRTLIEFPLQPDNFRTKNINIKDLSEDPSGNIWIVGTKPLNSEVFYKFDRKSETFYQYSTDPLQENTISRVSINQILIDRSRSVWLSTVQNGVYHFALPRPFNNFNVLSDSIKLYKNDINDIFEDWQGDLWIATVSNLIRYNPSSRQTDIFSFQNKLKIVDRYEDKYAIPFRIYQDRSNTIWLGTSWGIQRYDRKTNSFTHFNLDSTLVIGVNGISNHTNNVHSFYEDQDGNFWIGTGGGLCLYDRQTKQFQYYQVAKDNIRKYFNKNCVYDIYDNNNGTFWLGTHDGLVKFDVKSKTMVNYPDSLDIISFNTINTVNSLYKSTDGRIWLGSLYHGLTSFDPKTEQYEHHTKAVGLHGKNVSSVTEDDHGKLWIRTVYGLVKYDPVSHATVCYDRKDNVLYYHKDISLRDSWSDSLSNEFSNRFSKSLCKTRSGWIYVGGINGITYFHPDSLTPDKPPNIIITKVDIEQRHKYTINRPDELKNIVLPWHDNFFTISFALLDFYSPKENKYKYILEGLEKDWIDGGNNHQVTYLNVAPGKYIFRIVGENSDGIRSQNEASLNITIFPPYWQRLWFKILIILLSFSIVLLVFYQRNVAARRQRIVLESLVAQRTQELSEKTTALQLAHNQLEDKVLERTRELASANEELKHEIEIRRQAEESLKQSEEITRVLINAPVDLAILIDPKGNILALNKSAADHFKIDTNQMINHNLIEFLPSAIAESRFKQLQKCIKTRLPQEFEDANMGKIYLNHFYPIVGTDGNVISVAVYTRDITEQKNIEKFLQNSRIELEKQVDERTEELKYTNKKLTKEITNRKSIEIKLRSSEQKYRDLFQNANDLIWISDDTGKFISVNNHLKTFSGYSKKELINSNPLMLILPEDRFRMMRNYLRVLKNNSTDIELKIITKKGEERTIWLKMRPIIKKDKIVGVHGIGRDITELKRAQNELRASEEQKRESLRQFTLKLAHEIKNPLASIKSSAQLVAAFKNETDPQIAKHMEIINRNVDVCNKVIRNLYSYTHLYGNQLEEKDASVLIHNLHIFLQEKMVEYPNLKIAVKVADNLPQIYIDEFHLAQAFYNIITNAIEAMSGKGKLSINIQTNARNKTLTFECKDNGAGIPKNDLSKIFQPFYSTKSKGFGIGLTSAREIIENHHGNITVTSTPKRGTTFKVILPTM